MTDQDRDGWCAGNWNAYVEGGQTQDERRERFAEVPQEMKAHVHSHLKTVAAVMAVAKRWKARAEIEAQA